jgi:hypothetical protein
MIKKELVRCNAFKITKKEFFKKIKSKEFNQVEAFRGIWYYKIRSQLDELGSNHNLRDIDKLEKAVILYISFLAVWNRANRTNDDINYDSFKKTMDELEDQFKIFDGKRIEKINNLSPYKGTIVKIFDELEKIKGIRGVGASKVMHMRCPYFFLPWDTKIRNCYKMKLPFTEKRGLNGGELYYKFLLVIQKKFKMFAVDFYKNGLNYIESDGKKTFRTFAKAVDEYNYLGLTAKKRKLFL